MNGGALLKRIELYALKRVCRSVGAGLCLALGASMAAAEDECLAPSASRDADVLRHAEVLTDERLCLSELDFAENGVTWQITVIDNTGYPIGPTMYLLHDNEDTAFDAALYGLRRYGGKIVAIETGERRTHEGQDPNLNFGETPRSTVLCEDMNIRPAPLFSQLMLDMRDREPNFILTLHNNIDGYGDAGGNGGISAAQTGGAFRGLLAESGMDEDDALLLAGTLPYETSRQAQRVAGQFLARGVNVIYEHVTQAGNDCSFSNYAALNQIAPYYNIEAQHGHLEPQKAILDALMAFEGIEVKDVEVR